MRNLGNYGLGGSPPPPIQVLKTPPPIYRWGHIITELISEFQQYSYQHDDIYYYNYYHSPPIQFLLVSCRKTVFVIQFCNSGESVSARRDSLPNSHTSVSVMNARFHICSWISVALRISPCLQLHWLHLLPHPTSPLIFADFSFPTGNPSSQKKERNRKTSMEPTQKIFE